MQNIKLCVFDMAGTTVHEDNLVYKTVQKAIASIGVDVTLSDCLAHGAGKEKRQAIVDILADQQRSGHLKAEYDIGSAADSAFATFQILLADAYDDDSICAFDGMDDFFRALRAKGVRVILNTGYDRPTAEKIIAIIGWQAGADIDGLITADDVKNGRPHADMIQLAMRQSGIDNSACVLKAGDSAIDIEEGKNAACGLTVGVLSGAQNRAQLSAANPDIIVDALTDLADELL